MSDKKKKAPEPAPKPAKKEAPPAKDAAPPKTTTAPEGTQTEKGKDLSETPVSPEPAEAAAGTTKLKPAAKLDPTFLPTLTDPTGEGAGMRRLSPDLFKLPSAPGGEIDWLAMRRPFLTRGVMLGDKDLDMIEQNWSFSVGMMMSWGLPHEWAIKVANIGTPLAYDFSLKHDYPKVEEKMEADIEKMMGPGKKLSTIVVPVITPDTLGWVTKKITGKEIDFTF